MKVKQMENLTTQLVLVHPVNTFNKDNMKTEYLINNELINMNYLTEIQQTNPNVIAVKKILDSQIIRS